jgi:uncharacterized protein (TIGR03000 family)
MTTKRNFQKGLWGAALAVPILGVLMCALVAGLAHGQDQKPISFEVRLPSGATLYIDDYKTTSTGEVRRFETPPLATGKTYSYTLKCIHEGKEVVKKIQVSHEGPASFDLREVVAKAGTPGTPATSGTGGDLIAKDGPPEQKGAWTKVMPLPDMQAIHAVLLPNGKVLVVNGSGNRDRISKDGKFEEGVDVKLYDVDNYTCLFDPMTMQVERIGSPPATRMVAGEAEPHPNDLFCGHKIHLYNGNVLFVSGSKFYYPNGDFKGHKLANIYNWKTGKWEDAGHMADGHWYPCPLPLADGRIAVFAGVTWEEFKISPIVDFYDPFAPKGKQWQSIDLTTIKDSPWTTPVSADNDRPDNLDLYPRIHALVKENTFLVTGHGAGGGQFDSKNSYLMTIGPKGPGGKPSISFKLGPKRGTTKRTYVASCNDPTSPDGDVLVFAGQKGAGSIDHGPGKQAVMGAEVVSDAERYDASANKWETYPKYLGNKPTDVRIMSWAVILPTKQILINGGGNYSYYRPVLHPILLTPDKSAPSGFKQTVMNPSQSPRLYHNTSLLLPDGRVFLAGGNSHRAILDMRNVKAPAITTEIKLGDELIRAWAPGVYKNDPPEPKIHAEQWDYEIYSPPYLFIPGPRPEITSAPERLDYGKKGTAKVKNLTEKGSLVLYKLGSCTHSLDAGQRLTDLEFTANMATGEVTFTAPTNRHWCPPAYYMLFYVNDKGKPSVAKMIQIGANDTALLSMAKP